jgi:cystathionine beta-lyase/cystathionine gamma-synthase
LGGVETTICAPVQTSHAKMSPTDRNRLGITDTLLRVSVGIEHLEDLVADFTQALDGKSTLDQPLK